MPVNISHIKSTDSRNDDMTTDLSVGEVLRRARLSSKKSLEDAERDIRIRRSILEDIENMDLDSLPGWIYTLGFVRTYSDYLDLDADKMIALLKAQAGELKKRQKLDFPTPVYESSLPDRWIIVLATCVLIIISILTFVVSTIFSSDTELDVNAIPPPPQAIETVVEQYGASPPSISETDLVEEEEGFTPAPRDENGVVLPQQRPAVEERAISEGSYRITIQVREESWIEIKDETGRSLISRVLKPGEEYFVPSDTTDYTMSVGNIVGIDIQVDGKNLNLSGDPGEVRRNIRLDPESLKEMFP